MFSDTVKICLENYIKLFDIKAGLLFKNTRGNTITSEALRTFYKKILKEANLNINSHTHDLRHCFCNKAFNQMLEKGYDENVVIVYLYKYMGHKSIHETEHYLHFTDYNKKKIIDINDNFSKSMYEGVVLDD